MNGSSGEVPAAETHTNGPSPIRFPISSCSGIVLNVLNITVATLASVKHRLQHILGHETYFGLSVMDTMDKMSRVHYGLVKPHNRKSTVLLNKVILDQ